MSKNNLCLLKRAVMSTEAQKQPVTEVQTVTETVQSVPPMGQAANVSAAPAIAGGAPALQPALLRHVTVIPKSDNILSRATTAISSLTSSGKVAEVNILECILPACRTTASYPETLPLECKALM